MKNEMVNAKNYADFMQDMIDGIDVTKKADWTNEKSEISTNIRDALVDKVRKIEREKDNAVDDKFLDYCNGIKSLLTIYNFGNLDEEDEKRREADKKLIVNGIAKILDHIEKYGYDITPNLDRTTCGEIFGDEDGTKVIPITLSATTVFTTLVYFRRAYKRIKLFTKEELVIGERDLNKEAVEVVSELMYMFYEFAYKQKAENRFMGWGVTLDKDYTKAVTLSDTYAVVDAISRFADAFTKDGDKRDEEFTKAVDEYAVSKQRYTSLTDRCLEATYKTAFNVYERTKGVYGKSVFYSDIISDGENVRYEYIRTTYEQISSSSRSSALFNPLYVAMITMYGYNDKELVIRRFMDSDKLANEYYDKYEVNCPKGKKKLSEYAKELKNYYGKFEEDKDLLLNPHSAISTTYGRSSERIQGEGDSGEKKSWREYYNVARVFQKYLEKYHPEDLMDIDDYRDYLNATKDAIDQVQIMYRDFDNHQRLGVVDTDYATFTISDIDLDSVDIRGIARLNKSNISVNNLRPMLLSSKIMIVNALTKYPQSDMGELYDAIKEARYTTIRKKTAERTREWVWNEDAPDMNSTARHIEAITYDYFDYYDSYELGFQAMQAFRSELGDFVRNRVSAADGSIGSKEEIKEVSNGNDFGQFKQLVLEITRQNVDIVSAEYRKNLAAKDEEIAKAKKQAEDAAKTLEKEKADAKVIAQQQIAAIKESYRESYEIGEIVKGWIRNEIDNYLPKILSMALINILNNGNRSQERFNFNNLLQNVERNNLIDAEFNLVRKTWSDIKEDLNNDSENVEEKIEKYNDIFKKAIGIQNIIGAASNSLLENEYYRNLGRDNSKSAKEKSAQIKMDYENQKRIGKLQNDDKDDNSIN